VAALQEAIASDPQTLLHLDLESMRVRTGTLDVEVHLPDAARDALTTGRWDGLSLLLHDFDEVRKAAGALPYVRGFK
jgi:hypothetical protein